MYGNLSTQQLDTKGCLKNTFKDSKSNIFCLKIENEPKITTQKISKII